MRLLLLVAAIVSSQVARTRPTTLVVHGVDPETGRGVPLSSASMYLDVWGGGEIYPLTPAGDELRVPLDAGWPCAVDKGWCRGLFRFAGRVTLRAEGYETISSDLFDWLDPAKESVTLRFPGAPARAIKGGRTEVITIPFRRPSTRALRIVDEKGAPVTDARVALTELQARSNHCAAAEGKRLFEGTSVADVPLPGGRVEYAVMVWKAHHAIVGPRRPSPSEIDGRFEAPLNTITLRSYARQPLRLTFRHADGTPARVEVIGAGAWGCMWSGGPVGTSDAGGHLEVQEFYPEEFSELFVKGSGESRRWSIDPRRELPLRPLVVTLK